MLRQNLASAITLLALSILQITSTAYAATNLAATNLAATNQAPTNHANINWPNHYQAAVSLSYDDALLSQLNYAIPALNKHGFKASFYLTLSNSGTQTALARWRDIAADGHELGNHTLFHACSKSIEGREWVEPHNNIDTKTVAQMQQEIETANTFLQAIDQQTERTFTPPCGDFYAADGNYIDAIRENFVAIKGYNPQLAPKFDLLLMPENVDGETLINFVKQAQQQGGIANILFHGIEEDYLSVSNQAHNELLQYLSDNRDLLWVDTYLNIMQHVKQRTTAHGTAIAN
ncbi:polysaccharide deacetylase family protein [Shewanella goraebulensis]|uniref:polysaccharide deacetylase family protein n=1 Tax=Shewanella goraebulensis TaxID=3050637 RepID=UPI00254B3919|nr:polysaccharide deacetylase family protein [Shewanella goraebulensis]